MFKVLPTFIFMLALFFSLYGQEKSPSFESLTSKLTSAETVEDFRSLVSESENLYARYSENLRDRPEAMARTNVSFAIFRRDMLVRLNARFRTRGFYTWDQRSKLFTIYEKNFKKLERLLRKSIEIYEKDLVVETPELATAKFELARSFEKSIIVSFSSSRLKDQVEYFSMLQELYLSALLIREKLLARNDPLVLQSAFFLANAYTESSDFDRALVFYERYIEGYREKYGRDSAALLPALKKCAEIWQMVGRQDAVERLSEEIFAITKKKAELTDSTLFISYRTTSFKSKGINPIRAKSSYQKAWGVTARGTMTSPGSTSTESIRNRSTENRPPVRIISRGSSTIRLANVVKVIITVDSTGSVIGAESETLVQKTQNANEAKIRRKAEEQVRKWKFRPFVYKGEPMTMKGHVLYYEI